MLKLYRCNTCGNLIEIIDASGVNPVCCGKPMSELLPGRSDIGHEKHVPVCEDYFEAPIACTTNKGNCITITIKVGETPHPMTSDHSIKWIALLTNDGIYRKHLMPYQAPEADFCINPAEKILALYSFCDQHGLWVGKPCKLKDE